MYTAKNVLYSMKKRQSPGFYEKTTKSKISIFFNSKFFKKKSCTKPIGCTKKIGWSIQNYGFCIFERYQKNVLSPESLCSLTWRSTTLQQPHSGRLTTTESQSKHVVAILCERPWDYHQHNLEDPFRKCFFMLTPDTWWCWNLSKWTLELEGLSPSTIQNGITFPLLAW